MALYWHESKPHQGRVADIMRDKSESIPPTPSPERPPLAPYDPPEPAPQAAAWRRALKVVMQEAQAREATVSS